MVAVGAPACGANAAVRSFVRMSLVQGYQVFGIYDSLAGLADGNIKPLSWQDVYGWASRAGSVLGTKRSVTNIRDSCKRSMADIFYVSRYLSQVSNAEAFLCLVIFGMLKNSLHSSHYLNFILTL